MPVQPYAGNKRVDGSSKPAMIHCRSPSTEKKPLVSPDWRNNDQNAPTIRYEVQMVCRHVSDVGLGRTQVGVDYFFAAFASASL